MKKFFVLLIVFVLFIAESYSQAGPGEDNLEETGPDVPMPGGIILVLIALVFGLYKMYKQQKQSISA